MNAVDETILLIQKIQDKPVEEKLNIIEESFNRQYAICLSAVKDHSFHMKSVQQSMILVVSEEPEEEDKSTPSSAPSDEFVKTMLASHKRMQKNIDQIQNQTKNRNQSKDRKVDDKPTGYPPRTYEPIPDPTGINNEVQRLISHLLHHRHDQLKENASIKRNNTKVPYLDPERSTFLIKGNMSNNVKRALIVCQMSSRGCPVCLYLIVKQPTKILFPHLLPARFSISITRNISLSKFIKYYCHAVSN